MDVVAELGNVLPGMEVPPTTPSREPGGRKAAVLEAARDREAPPHGGRPDPPAYGMEHAN